MKVTIIPVEESTFEAFAEKHEWEIIVEEIHGSSRESSNRYVALLKDWKTRPTPQCGFGNTPQLAIKALASAISGWLVYNVSDKAQVLRCPRFVDLV